MRTLAGSCALIVAFVGLVSPLGIAGGMPPKKAPPPSKYRKVADGAGNCVFSSKSLALTNEDNYEIKESFAAPEPLFARCYYAEPFSKLSSKGKVANSLRDKKEYYAYLTITNTAATAKESSQRFYRVGFPYSDKTKNLDTSSFALDAASKPCEFKADELPGKCLDVAEIVARIAKEDRTSPATVEVCLKIYIPFAESKKKYFDEAKSAWTEVPDEEYHTLAQSCVKYVSANVELPPAAPTPSASVSAAPTVASAPTASVAPSSTAASKPPAVAPKRSGCACRIDESTSDLHAAPWLIALAAVSTRRRRRA
jgi:MYXO-CTERM domain-containing protein